MEVVEEEDKAEVAATRASAEIHEADTAKTMRVEVGTAEEAQEEALGEIRTTEEEDTKEGARTWDMDSSNTNTRPLPLPGQPMPTLPS